MKRLPRHLNPSILLQDNDMYFFLERSTFKHNLTVNLSVGILITLIMIALLIKII
jgi:hypothetical protein